MRPHLIVNIELGIIATLLIIIMAIGISQHDTTIWINDEVRAKNLTNSNPNISYHPFVIGMGKGKVAELGFRSDGVVVWKEAK